ncbi:hypothetical protein KR215_010656, partial [Drosophila sulfurigaster]
GSFRITRINCKCYDTSFCDFTLCKMNVVRRGVIVFNMKCEIYRKPINDLKVHFELFRKTNGYQLFMLNHTVDYCFYMRNPISYPLVHAVHKTFADYTNLNHSCPVDHDIIVNNFAYGGSPFLEDMPMPNGEYMVVVKIAFAKAWRSEFKVFLMRTD